MPWKFGMKVAVALIVDKQQRLLVTQRPLHVPHGGYWEFPGGKLEPHETSEAALIREVQEEIGLQVKQYQLLGELYHQYPDKTVQLIIFLITEFSGEPSCLEGQIAMKWIYPHELNPEEFPEANLGIMALFEEQHIEELNPP
jgi:8-oxo-dGTP diphosphatase